MQRKSIKLCVDRKIPTDVPVSGSIGLAGEIDTYTFNVHEAGHYRVETQGHLNTVLDLLGPNDASRLIAQDNNSGWWLNARIEQALDPGQYTARVRHYNKSRTGTYTISVMRI